MKKILFLVMSMALIMGVASCSCDKQNDGVEGLIEWSALVRAEGDGAFNLAYPSGGLKIKGAGLFEATSESDSLFKAAPSAELVLANPNGFKAEDVAFVEAAQAELDAAYSLNGLKGEWAIDVDLYARQPQTGLTFVFVKHWPEAADSVAVR